ncbi:MAG: GNAT family N-acetyltransferase [Pseudomonadota bacterium]
MLPHPAFADREIPREVALGAFRLRWLTIDDLDEDYRAVMESAEALSAIGDGGWPAGLTREADLIDLAWHQREFQARRSFAWIIEDPEGAYLGCAYVNPSIAGAPECQVWYWFRSGLAPAPDAAAFRAAFMGWLAGPPWPALAMRLTAHVP